MQMKRKKMLESIFNSKTQKSFSGFGPCSDLAQLGSITFCFATALIVPRRNFFEYSPRLNTNSNQILFSHVFFHQWRIYT